MHQNGEFAILGQFSQPIEEIYDAGGAFEMKEFVAIGGGSTHLIGYVDTRVWHGLTVPVDEQFLLRVAHHCTIRLAFSGPQAFLSM